ncbi:MAG: hypothetical protein JSV09_06285, partial [Thermoplasmata archaeon]
MSDKTSHGGLVHNVHDAGKAKVPKITHKIDNDLIYPMIRGRDISRWKCTPKYHVLVVQDPVKKIGINETFMKTKKPSTYSFLLKFKKILKNRKSRSAKMTFAKGGAFYSMYDVIPDSFSEIKVVWRRMGKKFRAAVIGTLDFGSEKRCILPIDNVCFIPISNEEEAHYICALLN